MSGMDYKFFEYPFPPDMMKLDLYSAMKFTYPVPDWFPEGIKQQVREEHEKEMIKKFLAEKPWRKKCYVQIPDPF